MIPLLSRTKKNEGLFLAWFVEIFATIVTKEMAIFAPSPMFLIAAMADNICFKAFATIGTEIDRSICLPMIHIAAVIACLHESSF